MCANCIISQSSLFSFQINNILLIALSYATDHSILMMDSKDKSSAVSELKIVNIDVLSQDCPQNGSSSDIKLLLHHLLSSVFFRTVFQSTTSGIFQRASIHFHRDCAHSVFFGQ